MRKVIVSAFVTLDGVMEAPNQWSFQFGRDDEQQSYSADEGPEARGADHNEYCTLDSSDVAGGSISVAWLAHARPASRVDCDHGRAVCAMVPDLCGVAESLGAIGLILPGITRILPWLTPLAATGLMIVAGSATGLHLFRGETGSGILTAVLFVLLAFVAYMRWKIKPLPPRTAA